MNSHCFFLGDTASPYTLKGRISCAYILTIINFIDECYVFAGWKYQSKFIVRGRENVIYSVTGTIENLDIFHEVANVWLRGGL